MSIVIIAAIISVIIISKQFGGDGQLLPFIAICQQLKWQRGEAGVVKRLNGDFVKSSLRGSLNKYDWRNLTTTCDTEKS